MEKRKFLRILKDLYFECERVNEELRKENIEHNLKYEVLQFSDLAKRHDIVVKVADFYNKNWTGNRDFMHIPDFMQTMKNCLEYPIVLAREEGKEEILAMSTIKYSENSIDEQNPYFQEPGAKFFSITGILVNKDTSHRGMGKKIYEIGIRAAHQYQQEYPETRMMCEIDCRNSHSLKAIVAAVESIHSKEIVGRGNELPAYILGYYELRDKETLELLEAPTLIIEMDLRTKEKAQEDIDKKEISYHREQEKPLFDSLLETLKEQLVRYGLREPSIKEDEDCGLVYYYSLEEKERCRIDKIEIVANDTGKGNDRVPIKGIVGEDFIGPIQSIKIEGEER